MAIFSSLSPRRKALHKAEATQLIITFRLRDCSFGLPIAAIKKVVFLDKVYGDPQGTGVSLTRFQNQEILVIDVGYKIFGQSASNPQTLEDVNNNEQRYLAILATPTKTLLGLPIDSPPAILRVPESDFSVIPSAYLAAGNIQCISSKMIQLSGLPPIFLLEPELLWNNFFIQ